VRDSFDGATTDTIDRKEPRAPEPRSLRPWLVIHNPVAGQRDRTRWPRFADALARRGLAFDVARTSGPADAARLAERAVREGLHGIFVAGGDGTVHEAVNGLMRAREAMANQTPTPLLVPIPLGTGNDWARSLGLPTDAEAFADCVTRGGAVVAWHDVGRMRFDAQPGTPHWFVNVAGAGFDAHVIEGMPARVPSRLAYLRHALRGLAAYRSPTFTLEFDDVPCPSDRYLLAFVALGEYCGHRMHVAPGARLDDGLFDVVTIAEVGLVRALPKLARLYRGTILEDALVRHRRAASVRIVADPSTPVEADGQLVGGTPVTFSIEPCALRVMRAGPAARS
jgi:lipid kinase, YegS/Rv2252/BmrU family